MNEYKGIRVMSVAEVRFDKSRYLTPQDEGVMQRVLALLIRRGAPDFEVVMFEAALRHAVMRLRICPDPMKAMG